MAQNNIVTIEHLSKVYTERQIFQDTDFSINEGEKVALIGVNGTGKSTLLRIIAGLEEPDEGSMAMRRELEIRFLPQTPSFDPEDTILEAILHDTRGTSMYGTWRQKRRSSCQSSVRTTSAGRSRSSRADRRSVWRSRVHC